MKTKVKENDELDDLFSQIEKNEDVKAKKALQTGGNPDFLKLVKGQTVKIALLPYVKNPGNTFMTYEKVGFFVEETKTYVDLGLSPRSAGVKNDPVAKLQWNLFDEGRSSGNEDLKKLSYKLLPQREELVNVLVIEDSANEENNGTVKILKYGARMNKDGKPISAIYAKIREGVFGERKAKIGQKAFLTSKSDVIRPLIIKTKDKGGYNNYDDSVFDDAEEHGLEASEIAEIYKQCFDLEQYAPQLLPNSEIQELLDLHWFQTDITKQDQEDLETELAIDNHFESKDEIDVTPVKSKIKLKTTIEKKAEDKKAPKKEEVDDDIDDLIAGGVDEDDDDDFNLDD